MSKRSISRSRKPLFLLGAFFLVGCAAIVGEADPTPGSDIAPLITDTTPQQDAEAAAVQFLNYWQQLNLSGMYSMLSPLTQDGLSEELFANRYETLWRQAAVRGMDHEIVSSLVSPDSAQVRYRITLDSAVVGTVSRESWMDLTQVEDQWRVAWTDSTILPELDGGNDFLLDIISPTRANIYDHNGLALATQDEVVSLWIVPKEIGNEEQEAVMLSALSQMLGLRQEDIQTRYENVQDTDFHIPIGEISLSKFQAFESQLEELDGLKWRIYAGRYYMDGGLAPHIVGYVSQITEESVLEYLRLGYEGDELVGQTGLEAAYEHELRGQPGGTLYVRTPAGEILGALASQESLPPYAVYTTIDRELQRQAQQAIDGFTGAIVVLELDTGAVRTLVSSPTFDPNLFNALNPNSGPGLSELFSSSGNQPLLNRATMGQYPLGSVFKMVTMAAALESGEYDNESIYTCNGEFTELGRPTLYDWTVAAGVPDHGAVTLPQGLERSCNPYFWHIGLDLFNKGMPTALPEMATALGLGVGTGIEISEADGQVPDPEWKRQNLGEEWRAADAVQLAIGQSTLNVTPLQVARYIAALGNGGTLYQPRLVSKVQNAEGSLLTQQLPIVQAKVPVSQENLTIIQEAMTGVIRNPGGTARQRFLGLELNLAGKTGTASSGQGEPHAWFAGYSFEERDDRPDIAVVVILENQGEGSVWAAPVFRRVMESYFFGQPFQPYPWESQIGVVRTPEPSDVEEAVEVEATPTP